MSRKEFALWCRANHEVIAELFEAGEIPSIDRIDSDANYKLSNLRIISTAENARLGRERSNADRTAKREKQYPPKPCLVCGSIMKRQDREKWVEFRERKYCNSTCRIAVRKRDTLGRVISDVETSKNLKDLKPWKKEAL